MWGMRKRLLNLVRSLARVPLNLGFDPRKLSALKFYVRYRKDRKLWLNNGGKIDRNYMILSDFEDAAGTASGHYFHQDLLVAKLIHDHGPTRHIDVGSRVDGFVAHVAAFREIEVLDVRPLTESVHSTITFLKADLMKPVNIGFTDSLSCLHAIEHFGLGRYSDPVDVDGHVKGLSNLIALISPRGRMYVSFPIGQSDEVHFNAHRVFHPKTILAYPSVQESLKLIRFDFVDDSGNLNLETEIDDVPADTTYGCGIYTFEKL